MNAAVSVSADPDTARVVSSASIDDLDAAICVLTTQQNAVEYRLLLLVREFDDRCGWAKWNFASCAQWLAWRCGIGRSAAREKVRVAHALRDVPLIAAAFEAGRLSYSKVRALTRAANAANEQALLAYALDVDAVKVEQRCRQIRNVQPESVEDALRAWRRRSLTVFRNDARGTLTISVELPVEEGEVIVQALEKAVQAGEVAKGPEFGEEGWHAQQADALVVVAKRYLGGDTPERVMGEGSDTGRSAGVTTADRYQVVVHVDESALRGGAGQSELPVETIRRLACDGSIRVVTEDARGDPLDVGRRHRIVPPALRRALWARDRGCTFPGCGNRRFVDAHHLKHWVHGGETTLENTALLCTHHHRLVHEGGLRLRRTAEGEIEFRRADGRVIPRCGYRTDDAVPDPIVLDAFEYPSADAWLRALLGRSIDTSSAEAGSARATGSAAAGCRHERNH
jgi:hypothetical protein